MKLYALYINQSIPSQLFNSLLPLVSIERRQKIYKFIRKEDADRSLIADILLREALIENLKIENDAIFFNYGNNGKPCLINHESINFNISHSGNWVVCAINNHEVGIDIEKIDDIDFDIAKSFFSEKEYIDLMKKDINKRKDYFYDLWTLKESYIKACGKGLSLDLRSFSFRIENKNILFESKNNLRNYFFKQYFIDKNYKLSVCTLENHFTEEIIFKSLDSLKLKL
jgi:4'-phosphopantetheinyl transferase